MEFACSFLGTIRLNRMRRNTRQEALTTPSCMPASVELSSGSPSRDRHTHTCAKHFDLHALVLEPITQTACGARFDKWHSQDPHACGASLEASTGRPSTGGHTRTRANHSDLHANLRRSVAYIKCGTAFDQWHSRHPHASGAALELLPGRLSACTRTDSFKPLQLFACNSARPKRSRTACGAASDNWRSQHPHAFGTSLELSLGRPLMDARPQTCAGRRNLHANLSVPFALIAPGTTPVTRHSPYPHAFGAFLQLLLGKLPAGKHTNA